jgi:hypothetical protein
MVHLSSNAHCFCTLLFPICLVYLTFAQCMSVQSNEVLHAGPNAWRSSGLPRLNVNSSVLAELLSTLSIHTYLIT